MAGDARRFLRSKYWRNVLFDSSDGKCAECGDPLETGWHADHIVPYQVSGRTDPLEMQALCPSCNTRKGNRMNVDWLNIDRSNLRPGQIDAIDTVLINVRRGKQSTAIVLPPGYGKSEVIRVSATLLMCQQLVSRALILEPAENLRAQIINRTAMEETAKRNKLPPILGGRISTYEVRDFRRPFPPTRHKDANFLSATIQLVNNNVQGFLHWVAQEKREHGVPPVIYVDEAHTGSDSNEWGNSVSQLGQAGAFIVVMTGTPFRTDHRRIVGFDWKESEIKPVSISRPRVDAHGDHQVDIFEGQKTILTLEADFEYGLRQAWDVDKPPSICKLTRLPFDFDLHTRDLVTDSYLGQSALSQVHPSRLAGQLGPMLREDKVIEFFADKLITQLKDRKLDAKDTAGIVLVGNDRPELDQRENDHAERVAEILFSIDPGIKTLIATSAESSQGTRALERFQRRNDGDVLIVKQMGGVGYDVPRLKVCLDLSVVRTPTAYIQRLCRIARIWRVSENQDEWQMTATYITPDDALGAALWQFFVTDQRGETSLTNVEFVQTVEKGDGDEGGERKREAYSVGDLRDPDFYSDTNLQVSPGETLSIVQRLAKAVPPLQRIWTLPDMEKAIPAIREALGPELGSTPAAEADIELAEPQIVDSNAEQKADHAEWNALARRVAEKRLGRKYGGSGDKIYGIAMRDVQWHHKVRCELRYITPRDYTAADVATLVKSLREELDDNEQWNY